MTQCSNAQGRSHTYIFSLIEASGTDYYRLMSLGKTYDCVTNNITVPYIIPYSTEGTQTPVLNYTEHRLRKITSVGLCEEHVP